MSNPFLKKVYYTMLDWVTLGKGVSRTINGMKIRFPVKWSRYYESDYEAENYTLLKTKIKPGMHIIDIGAHLGLFSVACSKLAGSKGMILSFEPTPETYSILKNTLRLNNCKNVIPVQAAISNKEGKAIFYVGNTSANNSNSLVKNKAEKEITGSEVRLMTIDSAVLEHKMDPYLIKIDAEGAELDVLRGGSNTFRQIKPLLILGLHPLFVSNKGDRLEDIWKLLEGYGYTISLNGEKISKQEFCSHEGSAEVFDVHCF